ncbi:MAG: metallopeptidase TldD-related protein [Spirochaetia bacterium]
MMIKRLKEILGGIEEISAWRIIDRQIQGQELFFIRRGVDMQRSKDVRHTSVAVYRDFQEGQNRYRGSVLVQIHPTYTSEEIRALIQQSLDSAQYVRNEHYPLVEPGSEALEMPESGFAARSLEQWLAPLAETIYAQEDGEEARINSTELFLDRVDTRIINSMGLDVGYHTYEGYLELIVESSGSAGEVELYREMSFSDFEPEMLAAEVRRQLQYCRDRAAARPAPHLKRCPVLISGDPVSDFFQYYLTQSAVESVYSGISKAKVGESIQGEEIAGDAINLTLEPYLKNSPSSATYDYDGFALRSTQIVEEGRLKRYWGPLRFCHYLDVPPTGAFRNFTVAPGSKAREELRRGTHLEVVSFSDFITEPLTGDFGGEFRLAYYTDPDGQRYPVTGGSVSGNVRDVQGRIALSRETQRTTGFQGPLAIKLPEISVAGSAGT